MSMDHWLHELYEANYTLLYRYANLLLYAHVRSTVDVQDVIQDVFRLALERENRLRAHSNPRGWLIKATQNVCKNYIHKNQREARRRHKPLPDSRPPEPAAPVRRVDAAEAEVDLMLTLEELLSPSDRELVVRHCVEGYSLEAIAAERNTTPNALRVRIFRIRKRLCEKMSDFV